MSVFLKSYILMSIIFLGLAKNYFDGLKLFFSITKSYHFDWPKKAFKIDYFKYDELFIM